VRPRRPMTGAPIVLYNNVYSCYNFYVFAFVTPTCIQTRVVYIRWTSTVLNPPKKVDFANLDWLVACFASVLQNEDFKVPLYYGILLLQVTDLAFSHPLIQWELRILLHWIKLPELWANFLPSQLLQLTKPHGAQSSK